MDPEEHAAERPEEVVEGNFGDDIPFVVRGEGFGGKGLNEIFAVGEDATHGLHAAFVVAAEAFEPAHPAVGLPAAVVAAAAAAVFGIVGPHD